MGLFSRKKKVFSESEITGEMIEKINKLSKHNDVLTFRVDDITVQVLYYHKLPESERYGIVFFLYEQDDGYNQKTTSHHKDALISFYNSQGIKWKDGFNDDLKEIWAYTGDPIRAQQISRDIFEKVLKKSNYEMTID